MRITAIVLSIMLAISATTSFAVDAKPVKKGDKAAETSGTKGKKHHGKKADGASTATAEKKAE